MRRGKARYEQRRLSSGKLSGGKRDSCFSFFLSLASASVSGFKEDFSPLYNLNEHLHWPQTLFLPSRFLFLSLFPYLLVEQMILAGKTKWIDRGRRFLWPRIWRGRNHRRYALSTLGDFYSNGSISWSSLSDLENYSWVKCQLTSLHHKCRRFS